ncbi:MAG: 13E12 repeat family protein, partial [Myxococcota bacterium]|nr:13E12 repeat family protein [Myxococcota bacterium]
MFDVEDQTLNEHEDSPDREEDAFDAEAAEEELATLSSHLDAATYRQLVLIRQLDDSGHWADAGATTCAAWLSWRIGMNENAARERLRIAHALRDLPKLSDAMRRGELSYSKVRAIVRVATPQMEDRLLDYARYTTASQLERICGGIRQQQRLDTEEGEPLDEAEQLRRAFDARDLFLRARGDGTVQVVVTLMPDEAQRVFVAVETMRDAMREECPSLPPTYADAFVRLVDVGYEEATVELTNHSAESALETDRRGADAPTPVSAESTVDEPDERAHREATDRAHSAESRGAVVDTHDSAESRDAASDAANHSAEPRRAHRSRIASSSTPPPERPTTRRKKVSGGDTQRVTIQLAPHLLADGLVANLDDGTWIAPETWRR